MTNLLNEQEAALNEGLAEMPADVRQMRDEWLELKRQADNLNEVRNRLRDTIAERMKEDGVQGYVLDSKVKARTTSVTSVGVDSKALKEQMPTVWAKFSKITKSVRVTIS